MIKKEDPRLTAFVLGELSADESNQIRAAIDTDPELQVFVDELRETVEMLGDQYTAELGSADGAANQLLPHQRAAILSADTHSDSGTKLRPSKSTNVASESKVDRVVWLRWVVAAGIGALLVSLAYVSGNQFADNDLAQNGSSSSNSSKVESDSNGDGTNVGPLVQELSPPQIVLQSSKYPTESWAEYVQRMHSIGLVSLEQQQAWEAGVAIQVVQKFPTHLTRPAEPVDEEKPAEEKTAEEKPAEGEIVEIPFQTRQPQQPVRSVPYIADHEFRFVIPALGEQTDDQVLIGFSDLWFDEGSAISNTRNGQPVPGLKEQFQLAQRPIESGEEYARRLFRLGKITSDELARVEAGESFELQLALGVTRTRLETRTRMAPVVRMRTNTRTRQVPVSRTRLETRTRVVENEAGERVEETYTVEVPYTEQVTQSYTVQVPYTENVTQSYTVPVPYADTINVPIKLGKDASDNGLVLSHLDSIANFDGIAENLDVNGATNRPTDSPGLMAGGVIGGAFSTFQREFISDLDDDEEAPQFFDLPDSTTPAPNLRGTELADGVTLGPTGGFTTDRDTGRDDETLQRIEQNIDDLDVELNENMQRLGSGHPPVNYLRQQIKDSRELFEALSAVQEATKGIPSESGKAGEQADVPKRQIITKPNGKSWKRVAATANTTRLMVGDKDELDMQGMQVNVQVDGFRARVLIDAFYYNDREQQLEGNFKLRLPDDASLYYFAFGQSSFDFVPEGQLAKEFIQPESGQQFVSLAAEKIAVQRQQAWENVKEARMVPKEKAAFAYQQTVRRRVDPALVEWSGAGVFAARVFPLMPKKLHRIVVGYDVNLRTTDGGLTYQLDLPEQVGQCRVDLNVSHIDGAQYRITPEVKPTVDNENRHYRIGNSQLNDSRSIELVIDSLEGPTVLTSQDQKAGSYWTAQVQPDLPVTNAVANSHGMFLLDTSLSSNPDKFNVWLKLLRATLDENRDSMDQFAVLVFNVESYFWRDKYVDNTPENVQQLISDLEQLALEGATDLYGAVDRLTTTEWVTSDKQAPSLFLLSDGAATWGETNLRLLQTELADSELGSLYAYQTGLTGTAINSLRFLADQSGGAVFSVATEDEVLAAATAHRNQPWRIESFEFEGGSDVLTAGRVSWVYPGQTITMVGRGDIERDGTLIVSQGNRERVIPIEFENKIESDLASRMYGYVAVGQLESLGASVEDVAAAYARHFRVTGQTCSLLMLETEADYERFKIVPQEDLFVIKTKGASSLVEQTLKANKAELVSPKARLVSWVNKLQEMPGFEFKMPTALSLAIDDIEVPAISQPLVCEVRNGADLNEEFLKHLGSGKLDYEKVLAESKRRGVGAAGDAIKTLSSLVESNPGDLTLARDLAFVAMELDHPAHAYGLLQRVVTMRPFEPTVYPVLGKCLAQLGQADMAVLYYEIALEGEFQNRQDDFRKIVATEYMSLLRQVVAGDVRSNIVDYARARLESLSKKYEAIGENDVVITMMWNIDQSDVDLHVIEPSGEDCHYGYRQTKSGGLITCDITDGFGPEMYRIRKAPVGKYSVKVKYYGNRANRTKMRSKVYFTIYRNYGRDDQTVRFQTVELTNVGDLQDVLTIGIEP